MKENKKHSFISPSASERWINCPVSVWLTQSIPMVEESTGAAEEGTLAHQLAELKIRKNIINEIGIDELMDDLRNDPLYQFEMDVFTSEYLDFIESRVDKDAIVKVEECLDLGQFYDGMFGTVDCAVITDKTASIIDFKYGKNVEVEATNNSQLLLYAIGIYERYHTMGFEEIELAIFQPRMANIDVWRITVGDLLKWRDSVLIPAIARINVKSAMAKSGSWCRFCKGQAKCELYAKRYECDEETLLDPFELSNDEIGELIDKFSGIDAYLKKLKAFAEETILFGGEIPGWKMVNGRISRNWMDADTAIKRLVDAGFDLEQIMDPKILTPAKMEKMLGKSKFNELVGDLVERKAGKPVLAKSTDKRKEYEKDK